MSRKRRLLLQGWEPIRTIIKVGQNEWLPPLGGWRTLRKWRKPRGRRGCHARHWAAGLEPAAPPRRHFISLPCSREPEHRAAVLSGWHVTRRLGTSTRSLLHACFVSPALPGLTGAEIPAERCLPPPRRHYLASQLPVRLNLGSSGLSAPPCQPCTATASSCRTARQVQGQACAQAPCRRPRAAGRPGRSWQCPSHSRRHRFIPSSWGRCPRRGFESSDYLTAADTKPIFLPLPILSIVTDIFIQDLVTVSSRASFLLCF